MRSFLPLLATPCLLLPSDDLEVPPIADEDDSPELGLNNVLDILNCSYLELD